MSTIGLHVQGSGPHLPLDRVAVIHWENGIRRHRASRVIGHGLPKSHMPNGVVTPCTGSTAGCFPDGRCFVGIIIDLDRVRVLPTDENLLINGKNVLKQVHVIPGEFFGLVVGELYPTGVVDVRGHSRIISTIILVNDGAAVSTPVLVPAQRIVVGDPVENDFPRLRGQRRARNLERVINRQGFTTQLLPGDANLPGQAVVGIPKEVANF